MQNLKNTDDELNQFLQRKLNIINEYITLLKEHNISLIKKLCKEDKDAPLKLYNIKTEILKIDDKLDDLQSLIQTENNEKNKDGILQYLNLINEEKQAYMILNEQSSSLQNQNDYSSVSNENKIMYEKYDPEEEKIRKSFEEMIDRENKDFYEANKEEIDKFEEEYGPQDYDEDDDICYREYLDWRYDEYKKLYKEFYALVNSENVKSWRKEDFEKYMKLREEGSVKVTFCDDKNGNIRIYSKYTFYGLIKDHMYEPQKPLSKRQLPTEIFKYLISNNIIKEKDFKIFSKNQFGRTFEAKMGDILTENELPKEENRQKRYNKVDFSDLSEFPKSEYRGILYISNQWSEESISAFIDYIVKNYNNYIMIVDPHKKLISDILSHKVNADVTLKRYSSDTDIYEYEVKSKND